MPQKILSKKLSDVVFKLAIDLGTQFEGHPLLADIDLSPTQMRVLRCIKSAQSITPIQIADDIGRDKAGVTRILTELLTLDLVAQRPNPKDRRSKLMTLTQKSHDIFDRVAKAEAPVFERATQSISDSKLEQFFDVAEALSKNLSSKNIDD